MYPTRSLESYRLDDDAADEDLRLLSFKRLDPQAVLPTRGSSLAAGLDIYAIEVLTIQPGERCLAHTGLSVAIPDGYYGRLAPRSPGLRHHVAGMAAVARYLADKSSLARLHEPTVACMVDPT